MVFLFFLKLRSSFLNVPYWWVLAVTSFYKLELQMQFSDIKHAAKNLTLLPNTGSNTGTTNEFSAHLLSQS